MKTKTTKIIAGFLVSASSLAVLNAGQSSLDYSTEPIRETPSSDWMADYGIGVQAGTTGAGLHFDYQPFQSLYFRLEGNYFDYSDDFEIDDIDYDGDLKFSTVGLTANYLPFSGSGFKIIGGAYFGRNKFSGTATADGQNIEIGDNFYDLVPGDSLVGSISYNSVIPYLGLGWDWAFGSSQNYLLGIELGVRYMGTPDVMLAGTGALDGLGDIDVERQKIQDEVDDYKFYPVLKLSFTYRF